MSDKNNDGWSTSSSTTSGVSVSRGQRSRTVATGPDGISVSRSRGVSISVSGDINPEEWQRLIAEMWAELERDSRDDNGNPNT